MFIVDVPSRPHNVERRGTRVGHEGPRESSFVDASSDEGDTERFYLVFIKYVKTCILCFKSP